MPRFLGLEIQTDVRCASGARRAFFPATALAACAAVFSPTEPESLTATLQRTDARTVEVIAGRVVRTCFSDTAYDREWDIVQVEDSDVTDELVLTAQPIALRLARKLYETTDGATGAPVFDFTSVGITASEAIDAYVLPTLTARGMSWVSRGTVDATARFDLAGQWASALELVRLIAEPGRANAEWQLRRVGDSGYAIDLVDQIGSADGTLRIRTGSNLLAHRRSRNVLEAATRVLPRGADTAVERTMAAHLWEVAAKGTDGVGNYIEIEDILGGADAISYDEQLDDLYVASLDTHAPTPQQVTATDATLQRVYMASTAEFTVGAWCRFSVGATTSGTRLTSLTSPVAAALPSADGLGDLAEFLDVPEVRGDCNLVPNPWMRTWTTAGNAPDGWTEAVGTPANLTHTRETTTVRAGSPYALRLQTTGSTTLYVETPSIPVWAISGRRHFPALWFYVDAVPAAVTSAIVFDLYTAAGVKIAEIGRWVRGATPVEDTWFRVEGAVQDLSAVTGKVRIRATVTTTTGGAAASGWNVIFAHALLAESEIAVSDIEYSGGTLLWQAANRRLLEASAAVRGQELTVADLEADDPDVFASLRIAAGQDCQLVDTVLGEVATLRVLEYRPNYLAPLSSTVRVGLPPRTVTAASANTDPEPAPAETPSTPAGMLAIEGSFDEDGQLYVRVIGDAATAAIYCVVSTSGEPTEATLMQATPTLARQGEFTFAGPYDLGQTVYVAARGSSGANGQGGLSDVIRARLVRGNSATSKTIRLAAASVMRPYNPTVEEATVVSGYYQWTIDASHICMLPVPKGATLTAVRARTYAADSGGFTGDYTELQVDRIDNDGSATVLGTNDQSSTESAWETLTVGSLSEDTSGDRSYRARVFSGSGSGGASWQFRVAWVEYDLDVPNVNVNT